jgi:hypothetical protein
MEEILICENGVMRPATEAELAQMAIDEQDYQTNELPKLVRTQRDNLLKQSDWTQLSDVELTAEKKSEWATYRQELRDITNSPEFPNVVFPTQPQ